MLIKIAMTWRVVLELYVLYWNTLLQDDKYFNMHSSLLKVITLLGMEKEKMDPQYHVLTHYTLGNGEIGADGIER